MLYPYPKVQLRQLVYTRTETLEHMVTVALSLGKQILH